MALKIRMRKMGRKNRPFYRIILTDAKNPRDGQYLEMLGWYNPFEVEGEKHLQVKGDRVAHWLALGAQPSESAVALFNRAAPEVMGEHRKKMVAARLKKCTQKKQRRKGHKAAATTQV